MSLFPVFFKLHSIHKINIMARTSTYLNFPRNTEEVFNYYKSVLGVNIQALLDAWLTVALKDNSIL
jgi:hypothetical protein